MNQGDMGSKMKDEKRENCVKNKERQSKGICDIIAYFKNCYVCNA